MKKVISLALVFIVIAAGVIVFTGAVPEEKSTVDTKERNEIMETVEGALNVVDNVGVYRSVDGKIESLSDEELKNIISEFNNNLSRYYTDNHSAYSYYKWLNEYLLSEGLKDNKENTIDAGVISVMPLSIVINDESNEAIVEAVSMEWAKKIMDRGEYYAIENPIGRTHIKFKLIKKDNHWKVCENLEFDELDNAYDAEAIKETNKENELIMKITKEFFNAEYINMAKELINENERILEKRYSTYNEALEAAEKINVEYNRYILECN